MSQRDSSPERGATPAPLHVIDLLKLAAAIPPADPSVDLVERTLRRCQASNPEPEPAQPADVAVVQA